MKANELAQILNATVGNPTIVVEVHRDGQKLLDQDFRVDEILITTHTVVLRTKL